MIDVEPRFRGLAEVMLGHVIVADDLNAAMAALCASNGVPAERLSLYDLSGFADY